MCPLGPLDDLLARCPACGSILASDHLPSNPLVFAFWMVANGRLDCIIPEKSQWDSDTIFVLLKNNVTFSVLPSPPLTYTMLKLGKKFWIHASKLVYEVFRGGGGGGDGYALSKVISSGFRSNFYIVCRTRCLQGEG